MDANLAAETITIPTVVVNVMLTDSRTWDRPEKELTLLPGFNYPEKFRDFREAGGGSIPAVFMVTRMADGKIFGVEFADSIEDKFPAKSPFSPSQGLTVLREVQKKTRIITEEYVEFI